MPLVALSRRDDHAFPPDSPDVRGWPVTTLVDDETVGSVHDLLIDDSGAPRYLDIDLGRFHKHVLLPIGQARADADNRVVWVPGFSKAQFRDIPAYDHELTNLTRAYETSLVAAYRSAYAGEDRGRHAPFARTVSGPAGSGPAAEDAARPVPLSELHDHRVAEDEPDPRGWDVIAADDVRIGRIDELLIDTAALKVRFLACAVDEPALGLDAQDRHVLIPAGYSRLDESERTVLVDAVTSDDIAGMPVYRGDEVTRALARDVADAYRADGDAFYRHPRFDHDRFYAPPAT